MGQQPGGPSGPPATKKGFLMYALATINPFYAARHTRRSATPQPSRLRTVYAKLPIAPITASPVPELTSLYHNPEAGN